jgi:CDP-glycerol glycerophosphotransferase (TagB/SpsB family)
MFIIRNYLLSLNEVNYLYSFKFIKYLYKVVLYSYYCIRILLLYFIGLVSSFSPRQNKLWLFGSRGGVDFTDNAKYLYLYINKELKDVEAVWITKNKKVLKLLKGKGLPVAFAYSISGIVLCLRAKFIFTTHGKQDIFPSLTCGCTHIELYHFVIALKKLRYDVFNYYHKFRKILLILEHPYVYFKPDYAISSSSYAAQKVISSLNLTQETVFLTGLPRTDAMLTVTDEDQENYLKLLDGQDCVHLIYYLPTFRDYTDDFNYFAFGLNENTLLDFLDNTNSVLIIRYHPTDSLRGKINPIIKSSPRIIFENNDLSDSFSLLKKASVLITDYSGIFADYLLMNRPIIFANFDHDSYLRSRQFGWDYNEITPGPKVKNWDLLLFNLEQIIVHQKDEYMELRQNLKNQIYQYNDSNSCSRVIKEINRLDSNLLH